MTTHLNYNIKSSLYLTVLSKVVLSCQDGPANGQYITLSDPTVIK
jgi:hypothetical protein